MEKQSDKKEKSEEEPKKITTMANRPNIGAYEQLFSKKQRRTCKKCGLIQQKSITHWSE